MAKTRINLTMDSELLLKVDAYCRALGQTRSGLFSDVFEAMIPGMDAVLAAHRQIEVGKRAGMLDGMRNALLAVSGQLQTTIDELDGIASGPRNEDRSAPSSNTGVGQVVNS